MTDKPWKVHERRVAKAHSTERLLAKGRNVPDFITDDIVGECKYRKKLPIYLVEAMKQAIGYARHLAMSGDKERMPVVFLKEKGMRGYYIILHSRYAQEWFGDLFDEEALAQEEDPHES